ncbi:MAG: D-alanine--D-alanine ligase [Gammaproteobacteria bacterium]|nr:D-alanine--D-alanine ligase [Gammaproteobacteria bacterium]NIR98322.1 D-alanine--D-alanine ligase [Gammaproteobacteria bacterium]NIT64069.1 D-alanine--D-alanine ligase [Gammaproteobacteria bacterium]NIV21000.1 D-alanine--D-alanine ligase [Gammaproteobacteria bacterium]NIX10397.1 D-alanine--D-alanine ligase [Gammaproteobacteria bacterium]
MTDFDIDSARFGKVAVLMGGCSAEREISLKSGAAVLAALVRSGVDAHGVDAQGDVLDRLRCERFDRAFIMLHGRGGEDGVIQGALEQIGLPYTGSGVLGSALGMDKLRCKLLWAGAGLPTPEFALLREGEDHGAVVEGLGLPLIVKPVHEGSSIGMSRVERADELHGAWTQARRYDREVIAERWVHGAEYTATILGDQDPPLIRLETPREFYDFEAKYEAGTTRYVCPCGLPGEQEHALQDLARQAFDAAGASGWGRVDFLLDEQGSPWLIEVNTVPGMTDHSLVPIAARAAGIDFDALVLRILETSLMAREQGIGGGG